MTLLKKSLLTWMCVQLAAPAFAGPATAKPEGARPGRAVAPVKAAERYARRCQSHAPDRGIWPQGTLLWGTRQGWEGQRGVNERSSVLTSVNLDSPVQAEAGVKALWMEGGHLVASAGTSGSLIGTVLKGATSDGKPVEVAICGAEPHPEDPQLSWYRIEAWNPVAQDWENPCVATGSVPDPRALAVGGVWDASGARQDLPGRFTFACENGAITKCINWGYKPWTSRDGKSLAALHQACTRMARADYCGNGQSHTHQDTAIDLYDSLNVQSRTREATGGWDPARASFEAEWSPDGATCLARTRDGRALETVLKECPGRFQAGTAVELSEGDRCTVQRPDVKPGSGLLRNRSYGGPHPGRKELR